MNTQELSKVCRQVRRDIITMTANAGSGHPGGSLSAVELMTSVFFNHMHVDPSNPHDPDRDRFVLSKGHAAPCYYAVLAAKGFISRDEYANFRQLHSILQGHPDAKKVPGVDASTGSLGQGVSAACGIAKELKRKGKHLMAYSGYTFEQLLELSDPFVKKLLGQLDLLVDGPFIMAEKNIELRFRGSANQRVLDVPKSLEANEAVWAEQYR